MNDEAPANLLTQPSYDTVQVPIAAVRQVVNFFQDPKGSILAGAVLKTYSDTNFVQGGRLDKGKGLIIQGMTMSVRHTATGGAIVTRADYETIYDRSYIDLIFGGDTSFLRIPAKQIPAGNGQVEYRSNITPGATEFSMWHGASHVSNMFKLAQPLQLQEQETVQVELHIEGAIIAPVDIEFYLHGVQARPVR
jgi:hypothetical protein